MYLFVIAFSCKKLEVFAYRALEQKVSLRNICKYLSYFRRTWHGKTVKLVFNLSFSNRVNVKQKLEQRALSYTRSTRYRNKIAFIYRKIYIFKHSIAVIGKVLGPLSLLFYLYGIQNTLNSLILEPETVVQILSEIKNLCIEFALAQIEAGADIITISEDAAGELISRECYRSLVMQAEREIFLVLKEHALVVFHLSGNIMDRVDLFRDTGFHALSFDSRNDLPRLKILAGDMKLIGGVNNPVTMLNGKEEDIVREVFYALDNGVSLVAPECAIPLRAPNENLLAMRDAVLRYEQHNRRKGLCVIT